MAGYPPPVPPPVPPYGPPFGGDWRYQRRLLKEQSRAQRDVFRAQRQLYRQQMRSMRRSSIVGPLLLITVGIVFLLVETGRLSQHRLFDWYANWWPLILVGAGIIVLLEWFFDQYAQRSGAPVYRRSLGNGFFVIVPLLLATGILLSASRGHEDFWAHGISINPENIDEFLGDKHETDQTLDQAFPANAAFNVTNPRGDVTISGTSDDNQIHITVHKEVYSRSDSDASSKSQHLNAQLNTSGGTVSVSLPAIEGARANLQITLPPTAPTTVNADHGDVHISAIKAPLTILANHGDVELSAITGPVSTHINNHGSSFSAHSITGPVAVEGRGGDLTLSDITGPVSLGGEFFGTTHLEHIAGPVKFHTSRTDFQLARLDGEIEISPNADLSADQAVGPVTLTTRNRNITLERIAGDLSVTNRNGSVDLTSAPPLGNVTVENRNGSVNLTLPDHAAFTVQADTTNGDVQSDFGLNNEGNDNHKALHGTIGAGGPLIRITTSQGDVAVKRASILPLPPKPPEPPRLTALPPDARRALEDAREQMKDAQAQIKEAQEQAKEAQVQAQRQAKEAQLQGREAAKAAQQQAKEAQLQAREAVRQAQAEAQKAAADARRADKDRQKDNQQ